MQRHMANLACLEFIVRTGTFSVCISDPGLFLHEVKWRKIVFATVELFMA